MSSVLSQKEIESGMKSEPARDCKMLSHILAEGDRCASCIQRVHVLQCARQLQADREGA